MFLISPEKEFSGWGTDMYSKSKTTLIATRTSFQTVGKQIEIGSLWQAERSPGESREQQRALGNTCIVGRCDVPHMIQVQVKLLCSSTNLFGSSANPLLYLINHQQRVGVKSRRQLLSVALLRAGKIGQLLFFLFHILPPPHVLIIRARHSGDYCNNKCWYKLMVISEAV